MRRLSDEICLENRLSVIAPPSLSKGFNRAEYLGGEKTHSKRDALRDLICAALCDSKSFDVFIAAMQSAGCEVKRGKHLAFKIPGDRRFLRLDSLGEDYSETVLLERISGKNPTGLRARL